MDDNSATTYEQLLLLLYAYRMGTITFIELIERFEQVLQIASPQQAEQEVSE